MSEEQQQEQQPPIQGPGAILKAAREKLGLSTAEIAAKLHLKTVSVQAIEDDEYDPNISLTFTKGYLKLYAKQVNVTEAEVMQAFELHHTQDKEPAKLQSFSRRVAKQANDDRLMMITYLIIGLVAALVVVWWLQQGDSESGVVTSSYSEPSVEQPADEPLAQQQFESEDLAPTPDDLIVSAQMDNISQDTMEADTDLQQETADFDITPPVPEAAVPIELVFTFDDNCWMNLVDSTGEAIAYGVKKAGRVMPVSGVPPFEVTLGAPEVVQISYDGVMVDMSRFDAGKTAKFSLPFAQ